MSLKSESDSRSSLADRIKRSKRKSAKLRSEEGASNDKLTSLQTARLSTSVPSKKKEENFDRRPSAKFSMIKFISEMSKKQLHKTRNENSARYRTSRVLNRADDEMEANSDIQALNQFLHYLQEESDEDQTVEDGAEKLDDKPSSKRQFPIPTDISDDETDSEREEVPSPFLKGEDLENGLTPIPPSPFLKGEDLENGFTPIPPSSLHEEHQVISPQPSPFLKADEQGETITPLPLETSEADPEERTDSEPNSPHSDHGDQLALKDEDMQSLCRQCSELYLELGEKQTNSEHSDVEEADSGRGTASKDELESIAKSQIKVKVKRKQAKTKLPNGRHRIHYNLIDTPYASVPLKNIYLPKIKKKIKAIEQKKELVYCYMCGNYTSDTDHAYKAKLRYRQVSRPKRRHRLSQYFTIRPKKRLPQNLLSLRNQKHVSS